MPKGFLEELEWRGMIQDMTPGIDKKLASGVVTGYIGFDPTAPSLTLGNYVQIMLLSLFQRSGHKPIVLMGGATGRIGDPSGKDAERDLKSYDELDNNLANQVNQMKKLLDFDDPVNGAVLVNNLDFYKEMNVLRFLRDVGKNLTINYMMAKESVKRRIDTGMSYTEFSYQLLQAYDYLQLYQHYGCTLQMGGSDQWGNITSGTEFIRRNVSESEAYALTTPLLTKSDGKKFGKSEEGNIWLDGAKTSPYKFYQFWLNVDDKDLSKLIRYFTFKEKEEVEALENEYAQDPRGLKAILAAELTERIHGHEAFESAKKVSGILFNPKVSPDVLHQLTLAELQLIEEEIPFYVFEKSNNFSKSISDLLVESGIVKSKSEGRRAIEQNAIAVNLSKITDPETPITSDMALKGNYFFIENGKKNKYLIRV